MKTISDLDGFEDICDEQNYELCAGISDYCDGSTLKSEEEKAYQDFCAQEDQNRKSGQDFAPTGKK